MNRIRRLFSILFALIPLFIGLLALLNNWSGYDSTLNYVVKPLLTMDGVSNASARAFRSIHHPSLIELAFIFLACGEFIVSIFAAIGISKMLKAFLKTDTEFDQAKQWALASCLLGFLIWGLGFYTLGGDYFLSWLNPALKTFQASASHYTQLMFMTYIMLRLNKD